jgi:hypothetical protein
MKRIAMTVLAAAVLGSTAMAGSLFNGKNLDGWKVPKDNIWWKVEDGTMVVENGPKKKGSTLWTEKSFKDFEVTMEFKCGDNIDSGVFLRTEKQQIQIGVSGSLKRDMTCSPYIPGHGYPVEAEEEKGTKGVKNLMKINAWNTLKIRVVGPHYMVWLNGTQVLDFNGEAFETKGGNKRPEVPEEGPIGLQLHGGKVMKVEFRDITLKEL